MLETHHIKINNYLLIFSGLSMLITGFLLVRRGLIRDELSLAGSDPFLAGTGLWLSFFLAFTLLIITLLLHFKSFSKTKPFIVCCISSLLIISFFTGTGLWLSFFMAFALLIITLLPPFKDFSKTKPFIVYCISSLLIVAFCITSIVCTLLYQQQTIKKWNELYATSKITSISLIELDKINEKKRFGVVYVGRDDCPVCEESWQVGGKWGRFLPCAERNGQDQGEI